MERTSFEKLRIYQLSEDISDIIWGIVFKWSNLAQDTVGKQLIRASDSIGANIAEGCGRGRISDNRRFAKIAEALYMKLNTGFVGRLKENYYLKMK